MNPDILNKSIEPVENPGLETTDPRLVEIGSFIQNGNYSEAAALAQSIFEEDIYDIRIVGYFLYGIFNDRGLLALSGINKSLILLLQKNWSAFGPSQKKEKHAHISFNWLTKQLVKTLAYEEQKEGVNWKKWLDEVTSDDIDPILESLEILIKELFRVLEDSAGSLQEGLLNIKKSLTNFQRLVDVEDEEENVDGDDEHPETNEDDTDGTESDQFIDAPQPKPQISFKESVSEIKASWHLKHLLKKIEAFNSLSNQGKFQMAALVGDDINSIISNFDPTLYFPELFSGFLLKYAQNIAEINSCEAIKGSPNWKAMAKLYKADLNSFSSFNPGEISTHQLGGSDQLYGEYGEQQYHEHGDNQKDDY